MIPQKGFDDEDSRMTGTEGRFARLLGEFASRRPLYDTPILKSATWVAGPSLGALLPGWLIVIPRRAALNFRQWSEAGGSPLSILAELGFELGLGPLDYIWFEHGPRLEGTAVGCGVDYAHLHVLIRPPFSFDEFAANLCSDADLCWQQVCPDSIYAPSHSAVSYFAVGQGPRALFASEVESAGSQYIRRAVARLVGLESSWNYREFPQHENIQKTVELVDQLRDAVRR